MIPVPQRVLVVVLCLPICVLVGGCAGPALAPSEGGEGPCRREIRSVPTRTLPETSQLTCEDIGKLTFDLPAEPGAYLILDKSPRLLWKCRFYGPEAQRVLLRCEHHNR